MSCEKALKLSKKLNKRGLLEQNRKDCIVMLLLVNEANYN
jgi:hypothetical protein